MQPWQKEREDEGQLSPQNLRQCPDAQATEEKRKWFSEYSNKKDLDILFSKIYF